ncbi:MAG: ECF-type sigma factor [Planctomycetota bacterium]
MPHDGGTWPAVPEQLSEAVYAKLRTLATRQMQGERAGITLQPTALVHEAYLRLLKDPSVDWEDDRAFYWAAAQSMRRVLVDAARKRAALKRGGDRARVELRDPALPDDPARAIAPDESIERLDAALDGLRSADARMYEVVMLRYFAGLSVDSTAETLGVAPRTVKRDWATARSWLKLSIAGRGGAEVGG